MAVESNNMRLLEGSLEFLWTKQAAHLDNISNAETPNYKVKTVTFEESLDEKLRAAAGQDRSRTEIQKVLEDADWAVTEAQESTRMDGNGVNVTEQSLEAVRTAYQQQYVMRAISSEFSMLTSAIKG